MGVLGVPQGVLIFVSRYFFEKSVDQRITIRWSNLLGPLWVFWECFGPFSVWKNAEKMPRKMSVDNMNIGENREKQWKIKWENRWKSRVHQVRTRGPQMNFGRRAQLLHGKTPGRRPQKWCAKKKTHFSKIDVFPEPGFWAWDRGWNIGTESPEKQHKKRPSGWISEPARPVSPRAHLIGPEQGYNTLPISQYTTKLSIHD